MKDEKELYLFDPEKNKQCKKISCMFNKDSKYKVCNITSHKEYAKVGENNGRTSSS